MKASCLVKHSTIAFLSWAVTLNGWVETVAAATLPEGFEETVVFSGLVNPMSVRFSPDGRVFVAEKRGVIKVFDSLNDTTPDVFADLNVNVYNFWDRGLMSLALDPDFPDVPWVYVLYAYDAEIGGVAPRWGTPGVYSDPCPNPPGATGNGCVVSGRLSALEAAGNAMIGEEQVLIEDWCQQYPSHSVGDLEFGPDGMLYVSGGDGASFTFADYGQAGDPLNPCDDPPTGIGGTQAPPAAEGGTLRSQDLRTSANGENGDPVTLDGAILRVDPVTGEAPFDNPMGTSADLNARRIIAYGLRNPFRIEFRPNTDELWIGDVGWTAWEEINVINDVNDSVVENFGWPCYEGNGRQSSYDGANLAICEDLYAQRVETAPYHAYHHNNQVVAGEVCPTGSSSIAGLQFEFYEGIAYPTEYDDALFFADYSRDCIWAIFAGPDRRPDRGRIQTFVAGAANPVDLEMGPDGDLFYVDFDGGTIRRIHFFDANTPPVAVVSADPTSGAEPLTVTFDGTGSRDADGDPLAYDWDLDGDGLFGDSSAVQPSFTYPNPGEYTVTLEVSDGRDSNSATVTIRVGNKPPVASIDAPASGTTWQVDDIILFSGTGTDAEDGNLPASALSWSIILHHCP
ncbi:MAG TPA: PQQ-dependent sugar dehydrogenase, partial [Geminicoccaceae bacterium]